MNDPQNTIQQYISFQFFDSSGIVSTEFGSILYFSNVEILGQIREMEKTGTVVDKTRGGKAAGSVLTVPRSYSFEITPKYDTGRTTGKIRRLIEAIAANYRIKFVIYSGYLLWEEAFGTFNDYAPNVTTTFDTAIVDIGAEPTYRQIQRGYGLISGEPFPLTVYEGVQLPVPTTSNVVTEGGSIGSSSVNMGGININFPVIIP